jgi:hypothetical protein
MPDQKLDLSDALQLHQNALSRWDNEGGAGPHGPQRAQCQAVLKLTSLRLSTPSWCNFVFG